MAIAAFILEEAYELGSITKSIKKKKRISKEVALI